VTSLLEAAPRGRRQGSQAQLHALLENRSGLVVETAVTEANGMAERQAAQAMIVRHSPGARRLRPGADKGYDAQAFVADLRDLNVTRRISRRT